MRLKFSPPKSERYASTEATKTRRSGSSRRSSVDDDANDDDAAAEEAPSTTKKNRSKHSKPDSSGSSSSREVALISSASQLTPVELEVLDTRFGKQAQTIVEMLDMGNTDGASSLVVKSLLQSVVSLLPTAEQNVSASKGAKGIYGFNALITSTRELLGDLQAFKDRANIGQSIVDRSIRPAFQDIAVQIVQAFTILQANARDRMSKQDYEEYRKASEELKKGLGDYIMAQYKEVSSTVAKSLT